jgi:hypothetical protein
MGMKSFLKNWKPKKLKKLDKGEVKALVADSISGIVEFYVTRNLKDQKDVDMTAELFDKMIDEKFIVTLGKVIKDAKENDTEIDPAFAIVINDFIQAKNNELTEEIGSTYITFAQKIIKKKLKEIAKKTDLNPTVLTELLVVVPGAEYIDKNVGRYTFKLLSKLYTLATTKNEKGESLEIFEDTKQIKKLFKALFGEENLVEVASKIILEKKSVSNNFNDAQMKVWNALTIFALAVLNKVEDKDELKKSLAKYCLRREKDAEKGRDEARRVNFKELQKEEYKNLVKAVEKLTGKAKFDKYLG